MNLSRSILPIVSGSHKRKLNLLTPTMRACATWCTTGAVDPSVSDALKTQRKNSNVRRECSCRHGHLVWFALIEDRPLFAFAGIWTTFNGDRGAKSKPIPGPHLTVF